MGVKPIRACFQLELSPHGGDEEEEGPGSGVAEDTVLVEHARFGHHLARMLPRRRAIKMKREERALGCCRGGWR